MAGVWIGPGWASAPTPKILDRWHRLNLPRLGDWVEIQPNNLTPLPRYPAAKYPTRVDPNVVYWPTHLGGFAFGWFLVQGPDLGLVAGAYPGVPPSARSPALYFEWQDATVGSFQVPMWALPEYLMSVPSPDRGVDHYACPVVDDRYWANHDWRDNLLPPSGSGGGRAKMLDRLVRDGKLGFPLAGGPTWPTWDRWGPPPDDHETVDLGAVARSAGQWGDTADALLTCLGLRPGWDPAGGWVVQDFERAYQALQTWLAAAELRDGGPALRPDASNLPTTLTVRGNGGGSALDFKVTDLVYGADATAGAGKATIWLPVTRYDDDATGLAESPYARESARRMASRLVSWTTYPFALRTSTAAAPCNSALVGMWEMGPGYTVAHGLAADTWWGAGAKTQLDAGVVAWRKGSWRLGYGVGLDQADNEAVTVDESGKGVARDGKVYPAVFIGYADSAVGGKMDTFAQYVPVAAAGSRFARFSLATSLSTADASQAGCPVDEAWGGPDPGPTITVNNFPASVNYIFSGKSGAKGLALSDGAVWWIVQLECPGGVLSVLGGGTGWSSLKSGNLLMGDGTNAVVFVDSLSGGTF